MREFEPWWDLEYEDWLFWMEVTADLLALEDFERKVEKHQRYIAIRNEWRYGWLRKRNRRRKI